MKLPSLRRAAGLYFYISGFILKNFQVLQKYSVSALTIQNIFIFTKTLSVCCDIEINKLI